MHASDPAGALHWTSEVDSWFVNKKSPWLMPGSRNSTFTLDGKQAVLSLTNGGLAIVDLRDQMVRTVIDFSLILGHDGAEPDSIAVSPLGLIAAAFPNRHEVLLIDQKKMRVLERIKTSFIPMGLRFSPLGKFLFMGEQRDKHAWSSIYSIQKREYLLSRITPMVCDISRDDRYIYLYDETKNSLRWILTDTLQTVRDCNLSAIAPVGEPHTIKVLRDHRIAMGFLGSLVISDRYLERVVLTHIAPENAGAVSFIEPSHDNRFLIFGSRGSLSVLSLVNNLSEPLSIPAGAGSVSTYPNGNYILYTDQASGSARIMRITIPSRYGD
jgi:DNA-binding beta-propeller fold protein YncE